MAVKFFFLADIALILFKAQDAQPQGMVYNFSGPFISLFSFCPDILPTFPLTMVT